MNPDLRDNWRTKSWEEMAQENALAAVMTTPDMMASSGLTDARLSDFFSRGRDIFQRHIMPVPSDGLIVEYGCGAGRILRAVANEGYACAGIDISPTMVDLCRRFVPSAETHLLEKGRTPLPDGCASLVFSYAVVQHIALLSDYEKAFGEMCRLLRPGGVLKVQVGTDDFRKGFERQGRTQNEETYSVHFTPAGARYERQQDNWNGVCIGADAQILILAKHGVVFDGWRFHKPDKPSRVVWLTAHRPRL